MGYADAAVPPDDDIDAAHFVRAHALSAPGIAGESGRIRGDVTHAG
jgi:hypothetical protein